MAFRDFKDLARRTAADKVFRDKAFDIAKNSKYDGYQRRFPSMVYKFLDKKCAGSGVNMHANKSAFNIEKLAEEFHKPFIKKSQKRTVYSGFNDNIWGPDLADMQLISKFNKGFRFLLSVIDIFSKYAWVLLFKDKKSVSIVHIFQKMLKESNRKPNKNGLTKEVNFKKWLKYYDFEMYSTHNEGKSVVAERFIRIVKTKI